MTAEALWNAFCQARNIDVNTPYVAWAFCGGGPLGDELAELVLAGRKFGTASGYDEYIIENELDSIPKSGDYSVVLWDNGEAACVIRNYEVYIRPFGEVSPFHAFSEGEGDLSLRYWRSVHEPFFAPVLAAGGVTFSEDSLVVCEKFCLEYIPERPMPEDALLFVEPSMTYADEIMAYRQELLDADSSFDGCYCLKSCATPEAFIARCMDWSNPRRPAVPQGSRGTVLLAIRKSDQKMVGCLQVHHELTESMRRYTGSVGYSVRPSERRKGYAVRMLALAKEFLASFGITEFYAACLPENEGSKKTILKNGGEYTETVYLDTDQVWLERYRIRLEPAGGESDAIE